MRKFIETPLVKSARLLAVKGHSVCPSYSDMPYIVHPAFVARCAYDNIDSLEELGIDDSQMESTFAGAWLHDYLENVPETSYNDVLQATDELTAEIVYLLTDHKGRNRAERHLRTYTELRGVVNGFPCTKVNQPIVHTLATFNKCADRHENLSWGIHTDSSMSKKYRKEYPSFRAMLKVDGLLDAFWKKLDILHEFTPIVE